VVSEALTAHRALVSAWERMCDAIHGARFEPRSDLIIAVCPQLPIPQCNGARVVEDSAIAVDALPAVIAEVESAGAWPWVQTRSGHERTRMAARELGLTHTERIPGMVVRPGELNEVDVGIEIAPITDEETESTIAILARSFDAPAEVFVELSAALRTLPEATWYVGRLGGMTVSTGVGFTVDGATSIFNVATPPEHRRHGYGAALTARAASDGLAAGADFAFLQSSALGHKVYRQLGFRDVEEYILLTRPPST
jgi:ribosomal protein S18 acetylase RimI-like enzyme